MASTKSLGGRKLDKEYQNYQKKVLRKYQYLSSKFLDLPFESVNKIGRYLKEFAPFCHERLKKGLTPEETITSFLKKKRLKSSKEQMFLLMGFLQFIEREVLLFDALEQAYSEDTKNTKKGDLNNLVHFASQNISRYLKQLQNKSIRVVLTAHPTQFYPVDILAIRDDLIEALKDHNQDAVQKILLQLGKTPFRNQRKPTPFEEAKLLMWYLEENFYEVLPQLRQKLLNPLTKKQRESIKQPIIEIGFWPGGDRDGNPFVTAETTRLVLDELRKRIILKYKKDLFLLKRRLTFKGIKEELSEIEQALSDHDYSDRKFLSDLISLKNNLVKRHQGLFEEEVEALIQKVKLFGFYFASLDLRQDSSIHGQVFDELGTLSGFEDFSSYLDKSSDEKLQLLELYLEKENPILPFEKLSSLTKDSFEVLQVAKRAQTYNGQKAVHRYIISHTEQPYHMLEVLLLSKWAGIAEDSLALDIVPLFETIDDLKHAEKVMDRLFTHPVYRNHLKSRANHQTIMLGFSDGTKDGGYLSANLSILKAKIALDKVSRSHRIKLHFFDGRGGPPARGGGNTHRFYQAMQQFIDQNSLQVTIQGQTVTSNFGTKAVCYDQLEKLLSAIFIPKQPASDRFLSDLSILDKLSDVSLKCYQELKNSKEFLPFLEKKTPLKFLSKMKVASRPTSRKKQKRIQFEDLRAIPFVASWSLMKVNIPGFYGLGFTLGQAIKQGQLAELQRLYRNCAFFTTLIDNCMQSILKSHTYLTNYLLKDEEFGKFWDLVLQELKRTIRAIQKITKTNKLLGGEIIIRRSIDTREHLIEPLLIIHHYALALIQKKGLKPSDKKVLEKLILKSIAACINASRNAA